MPKFFRSLMLFFVLLSVSALAAQESCAALFEETLRAVGDNCAGLARDRACIGSGNVRATFLGEARADVLDDVLAQPGDTVDINDMTSLSTTSVDTGEGEPGIALMNIGANLPAALPNLYLRLVLIGNVKIENAVPPEEAFLPPEAIAVFVATRQGGNIRAAPGLDYRVIGAAPFESELSADGRSTDGDWLRVAFNNRVGWIHQSVLEEDPSFADLTIIDDPRLRGAMQSIYLSTGNGESDCDDVLTDYVLVQSPSTVPVDFTVNAAPLRVNGIGALAIREVGGQVLLEVATINGSITVLASDHNPQAEIIWPGYRTQLCLSEPENRGLDDEADDRVVTCAPSEPELIPDFGADWCHLEQIPASILNDPIEVLCPGEVVVTSQSPGGASPSQIRGIDCSNLSIVSPLTPVDAGFHTFSWTGASGDNLTYELVFYNVDGNQVETFRTTDTSYFINLGAETSTGGQFSWEVRVYQDGAYACVSARSPQLIRTAGADPRPAGGSGQFGAGLNCYTGFSTRHADIDWWDAPAGASITLSADNFPCCGTTTRSSSSTSGTFSLSTGIFSGFTNITLTANPGGSVSLGDCRP